MTTKQIFKQALFFRVPGLFAILLALAPAALALSAQGDLALGIDSPEIAAAVSNLAGVYHQQGKEPQAAALYKRVIDFWLQGHGTAHPDVALAMNNLADVYRAMGRYDDAETLYLHALGARERYLGREHSDVAATLKNLAALYHDQGDDDRAAPYLKRAAAIAAKRDKQNSSVTSENHLGYVRGPAVEENIAEPKHFLNE
jgi:tetratricopeptide (TPR) repeat protein